MRLGEVVICAAKRIPAPPPTGGTMWATNNNGIPAQALWSFNTPTGSTLFPPITITEWGAAKVRSLGYDGTNIWVGDANDTNGDSVTVVDPITGTVVTTYVVTPLGWTNFIVPLYNMAFDGTNMWIPDSQSRNVYVVNASTGVPTSFSPVVVTNGGVSGVAIGGGNAWITCNGPTGINVVDITTGIPTAFSPITTGPGGCGYVAFDGTNIWADNLTTGTPKFDVYNATTGIPTSFSPVIAGNTFNAIAFDGTNAWFTGQTGIMTVVSQTTGIPTAFSGMTAGAGNGCGSGMAFDGTNIWYADNCDNYIYLYDAATGAAASTPKVFTDFSPYALIFAP